MEKDRFRELCNSYFLDDITSSELDELNSALNSDDKELLEIFYSTRNIFEHLPLASEMQNPTPALKAKINASNFRSKNFGETAIKFFSKVYSGYGI